MSRRARRASCDRASRRRAAADRVVAADERATTEQGVVAHAADEHVVDVRQARPPTRVPPMSVPPASELSLSHFAAPMTIGSVLLTALSIGRVTRTSLTVVNAGVWIADERAAARPPAAN
jgi:hypothetical protein